MSRNKYSDGKSGFNQKRNSRTESLSSTFDRWMSKKQMTTQEMILNRLQRWIGDHLVHLELPFRGLRYFKEALKTNPLDLVLLLKRANVYGKCFEMQKGLNDIEKLLRIDPMNVNGLVRRVEFLYLNGEFEKCLMYSLNYSNIRRQPPYFSLGCLTAKNAIEDCIGRRAGHPLRDYFEMIRAQAWQENAMVLRGETNQRKRKRRTKTRITDKESLTFAIARPAKPVMPLNLTIEDEEEELEEVKQIQELSEIIPSTSNILKDHHLKKKKAGFSCSEKVRQMPAVFRPKPKSSRLSIDSKVESTTSLTNISLENSITSPEDKFPPILVPKLPSYPYHPLQERTTNIENYLAGTYLGQLHQEKRFLSSIPTSSGYNSKNVDGNKTIVNLTKVGLNVLEGVQEILHTRKPFYNIKYQELLNRSRKVELDNMKLLEIKKVDAIKKLNYYFVNIAKYVRKMDIYKMNKMADQMYRYCKNTNKAILPGRDTVLCRLYKLLRDGILFSYRFLPGMPETQMMTRVHIALNLPIQRRISQESLLRKFKKKDLNLQDLIQTFENRVRNCKYSEEIIWLYHELSKHNLQSKRFTMAKSYCARCIYEARKCEDFKWAVNGYMMMTRIAVLQANKNDVKKQLRLAVSAAKNVKMKELDAFLQACIEVMNEWKFEKAKPEEIAQKRQDAIMKLLQPFEEEKRKALLIFDYMKMQPPDRRLPIIYGIISPDDYDKIQQKKEEKKRNMRGGQTEEPVHKMRGMEAYHLL